MRLERAVTIEDLRRWARRRLPRAVFDFVEGGAGDEVAIARNRAAFERLAFQPRVLVDVTKRDQATTVLGVPLATPVLTAPTGMAGLSWPKGELVAARAAHEAGTVYTLSTHSSCSIEEVAEGAPGPLWFQLYVWRNRDLARSFVERARRAGYRALVLTVDVPIPSTRERDVRNGFTIPPRVTVWNAIDTLRRPGWIRRVLLGPRLTLANLGAGGAPRRPRDPRRRGQPPDRSLGRLGRPGLVPLALVGATPREGRSFRRRRPPRRRARRRWSDRLQPRRPPARRCAGLPHGPSRDRRGGGSPRRGAPRRRRPAGGRRPRS
ncbi:MAG: hypothetical protein DMD79_26685 [Candidatus Rokuibacteriota bacterium]|nr:MAG: hypothetical protein DMD79_26685 [Candidatus Rokubacteria bacterium]